MPKKGRSSIEDRLHRIEGQLRGIEQMLQEGQDMRKIMTQIEAVISGLQSVKIEVVKRQVEQGLEQHVQEALELLR